MHTCLTQVKKFSLAVACCLSVAAAFFISGCATTSGVSTDQEKTAIKQRLQEIFQAAETKDLVRLDSYHWYGPHFTKFAGTGPRQDAATARDAEHKGLSALAGLTLWADDLKIDLFGDTAVATFTLVSLIKPVAYTMTKKEGRNHGPGQARGSWKIVHEHFSAAE